MTPDETEILERESHFLEAWERGDAKAAVAYFSDGAMRVGAFGDVAHGKKACEEAYQKLLSGGPMKGAKVRFAPAVKFYDSDVAVIEGPLTITPAAGPPMEGYSVEICQKRAGHWWLAEAHPKFYPPRPTK